MEIHWSGPPADLLERICEWIERDNPEAARRVAITIYNGIGQLSEFPALDCASIRLTGRRELVFPPLPYIPIYQVKQNHIEISRIFHAAQDWP
jgi:plasmid stabilization system protein ParE